MHSFYTQIAVIFSVIIMIATCAWNQNAYECAKIQFYSSIGTTVWSHILLNSKCFKHCKHICNKSILLQWSHPVMHLQFSLGAIQAIRRNTFRVCTSLQMWKNHPNNDNQLGEIIQTSCIQSVAIWCTRTISLFNFYLHTIYKSKSRNEHLW